MSNKRIWIFPAEPFVSLILLGVLFTGAVFYAKSVKFQRFLEPLLSVLEPRNAFSQNVKDFLFQEFGKENIEGIEFSSNTIRVRKDMLTQGIHDTNSRGTLMRLGGVFNKVLSDPWMRTNMELVVVAVYTPFTDDIVLRKQLQGESMQNAQAVLDAMLVMNSDLLMTYSMNFTSAAIYMPPGDNRGKWVEFRIIPSERLHAEVMRRLEKYAR